ncbi:tyrosine-type recombinase/integrase [Shigella flexneri]
MFVLHRLPVPIFIDVDTDQSIVQGYNVTFSQVADLSRPSAYSSWFNSRVLTEALGDSQDVSLHSLRHWLATRMKERGVNLVDAQGILGHSSQSITYDLYGKGHAVGRLADVLKTALL